MSILKLPAVFHSKRFDITVVVGRDNITTRTCGVWGPVRNYKDMHGSWCKPAYRWSAEDEIKILRKARAAWMEEE